MTDVPSPIDISSWPQAVVAIVIILAVLVWPGVLTYLNAQRTKAVHDTLTQNNGGSSVKDSLDRIEGKVDTLGDRVTALEARERPQG